jgi:hypothetical protein
MGARSSNGIGACLSKTNVPGRAAAPNAPVTPCRFGAFHSQQRPWFLPSKEKEVGQGMGNRKRFLQLLLIGAALLGVFMIQAGTPNAGILTSPKDSRH